MEKKKSFYFDLNTRLITKIKIINTKLVNPSGFLSTEYILYIFKVITPYNCWYIKKRYSEINDLFDFLVFNNPKLKFPTFPPKRFFSTKESTIIERKNGFEELFFFVLDNIDILKYTKLIHFFKIKKTTLSIYIENCSLVNENKYTHEILDIINSSSSSNSNDLSQNSDDSNKDKDKDKNKIKNETKKEGKKQKKDDNNINNLNENSKNINKIKENENLIKNNINQKKSQNNNDINSDLNNINNNNINNAKDQSEKKNIKQIFSNNGNYFRRYEDFKLATEEYTHRSQVSFLIVKEFLRNLKVHSSHIFEIINDFTNYLKYKNKWKKFNENEIKALFIGINKDELIDDYYQYIFSEEKISSKITTGISDKTTLSSTPNSISANSVTNININNSNNNINVIGDDISNKNNTTLEGLLFNIGKFEENYLGARSCLQLFSKIFERQFNPEVDSYIALFKKIDIKYIKKMNLCKFSTLNNYINQKMCFEILNIYISGYNEKKQVQILTELNANDSLIKKILQYNYKDDIIFNSFNLE